MGTTRKSLISDATTFWHHWFMMFLADLIIIFHFQANLVTKKTFIITVGTIVKHSLFPQPKQRVLQPCNAWVVLCIKRTQHSLHMLLFVIFDVILELCHNANVWWEERMCWSPIWAWSKSMQRYVLIMLTTWKTRFGNRHRLPLVTGNAPVTDQVLQIRQER
jgi:hypothetical protein